MIGFIKLAKKRGQEKMTYIKENRIYPIFKEKILKSVHPKNPNADNYKK